MTARREAPRLEIIRMLRSGATRTAIAQHFRIKPARVDEIARQLGGKAATSAASAPAVAPRRHADPPAPLRLCPALRAAAAKAAEFQKPLISCTSRVKDDRGV